VRKAATVKKLPDRPSFSRTHEEVGGDRTKATFRKSPGYLANWPKKIFARGRWTQDQRPRHRLLQMAGELKGKGRATGACGRALRRIHGERMPSSNSRPIPAPGRPKCELHRRRAGATWTTLRVHGLKSDCKSWRQEKKLKENKIRGVTHSNASGMNRGGMKGHALLRLRPKKIAPMRECP